MSDLTATACGCNSSGSSCNSLIWIILLLALTNNNGIGGIFGDNGCGIENLIILLLLFCNNGNGSCGCN